MFEKKSSVMASVLLITLFGAPLAANAATPAYAPVAVPSPIFQDDDEYEDDDEDDDEDEDEKHHDERHEIIPPVITVPGLGKGHHRPPRKEDLPTLPPVAENPTTDPNATAQSLSGVDIADADYVVVASNDPEADIPLEAANPNESQPIDVKLIRAQMRTPADQFLESAYIGMGVLGAAAIGLGATAGVRAIRLRRSGKSDYFYDNK
ncbi:MAG: hypothetical protein RLZZ380_417 [Actinomycetota bacterium]|jgi:hypothetical protein